MTISEFRKLYPNEKKWLPLRVWPNGSYSPNWNYYDDDIVLDYKEVVSESFEITKALLNKGRNGKIKESRIEFKWNRRSNLR